MALIELTLSGYVYMIGFIYIFGPALITYMYQKEASHHRRRAVEENMKALRNWRNR